MTGHDAPAARREPDRVGSQVDDQLVKPLFVTPVHEVDAETLALEGHPASVARGWSSSKARSTSSARSSGFR